MLGIIIISVIPKFISSIQFIRIVPETRLLKFVFSTKNLGINF